MKKEVIPPFKVGEEVYIKCNVLTISKKRNDYPIQLGTESEWITCATKLGELDSNIKKRDVFRLEELIPKTKEVKSEFPKVMIVSSSPDFREKQTRVVLCKIKDSFIGVSYQSNIDNVSGGDGITFWKYAKDIEPENPQKKELMVKADELIKKANELKKEAEKL